MNPLFQNIVGALARQGLAMLGAYLVSKGLATEDQVSELAGWASVIVAIAWSIWQKYGHLVRVNTALAMPPGTSNAALDRQIKSGETAPAVVPKTVPPQLQP